MIINFEGVGHRYRKLIKTLYEKALELTNNRADNVWVTVSFVNRKRIKELNNQYRQVDRQTDVLSLPMLDIVYPQTLSDFKGEYSPDGMLYIGDVVICSKVAKWQAKLYGHSKKREVGFLALHGFLHILGFDHIESEDEKVMMDMSNRVLDAVGLKRD